MKYREIREKIDQASERFTSVGSYPLYSVMKDGGVLCPVCVKEERKVIERAMLEGDDRQWEILGTEINDEDPALFCVHCGERIESAYAEPESQGAES